MRSIQLNFFSLLIFLLLSCLSCYHAVSLRRYQDLCLLYRDCCPNNWSRFRPICRQRPQHCYNSKMIFVPCAGKILADCCFFFASHDGWSGRSVRRVLDEGPCPRVPPGVFVCSTLRGSGRLGCADRLDFGERWCPLAAGLRPFPFAPCVISCRFLT